MNTKLWTAVVASGVLLATPLSPVLAQTPEQEAQDRAACQIVATRVTGFDPITTEEPPRTITTTEKMESHAGSQVVGGAARGAAVGALGGAIAGDAGTGAAAGAAIGGLMGGARHRRQKNTVVEHTQTNPEYTAYKAAKDEFRTSFNSCMVQKGMEREAAGN